MKYWPKANLIAWNPKEMIWADHKDVSQMQNAHPGRAQVKNDDETEGGKLSW